MNDWFIYLIKAEIGLLLFFAGYYFFFQNDKFFKFNRLYLLSALILSAIIPVFQISFSGISGRIDTVIDKLIIFLKGNEPILADKNFESIEVINESSVFFTDVWTILFLIYIAGVSFFLARFLLNFSKLFLLTTKNQIIKTKNVKYVLIKNDVVPHSFFNYIFISLEDYESKSFNELIAHEEAHVRQLHTIDVIVIEFFQIFHWFNPFIIIFKRYIKANHEFLADKNVIVHFKDIKSYQEKLLQFVFRNNSIPLASNINYSLTKKRLKMITKKSTKKVALWKRLMILPILMVVVFVFAGFDKISDVNKSALKLNNDINVKSISENNDALMVSDTTKTKKQEPTIKELEENLKWIEKKAVELKQKQKKLKSLMADAEAKGNKELVKKYVAKMKTIKEERVKVEKKKEKILQLLKEKKS